MTMRIYPRINKAVGLFALASLSGLAFGQANIVNGVPVRQETNIFGRSWSTTMIQPQIQQVIHTARVMPAHADQNTLPFPVPNQLPLGTTSSAKRAHLKAKFRGISATGYVPPDPNTAVGPNHIVQVVNSDIAFFNKANGLKTFQIGMEPIPGAAEGFFESLGVFNFVFDPKCTFDKTTGRFFVVALELDQASETSKVLVAVSDDEDPNGTWFKYRVEAKATVNGNATWMDYPSIAVNKDAFVVSGNQFGFSAGGGGVQVLVLPKAPLLTGSPATSSSFLVTDGGFTLQPARTSDPNIDKIYCVATSGLGNRLNVYAFTNLAGGTPTLNSVGVTVPNADFPFSDPPSVGGRILDNIGNRLMTAAYANGKLYASQTVSVSGSDNRNAARWYEIATNDYPTANPTYVQGGNVGGGAGQYHFQPAIGVNSVGDVAMVFSRSSSSIVADVMTTGRRAVDPPGTMGAPTLVESSLGSAYGFGGFNRWGDYFSMEVDPVDNTTFWATCMIADNTGDWLATFYKLTISDILPGQSTVGLDAVSADIYSNSLSNPNAQGENFTGVVEDVRVSDNNYVTIDSVAIERLGQVAACELSYIVDGNPNQLKTLGAKVEALAPAGTTGMIWLYDFVSEKYVQVKSFKMKQTGNASVEGLVTKNRPRYVGPGGLVKVVFRALKPIRTGRGQSQAPTPFTVQLDLASARVRF